MENQLTVIGVYPTELPKEYFDRVPFKDDLMTIEVGEKDTLLSICKPLRKKYPKFKKEIKAFVNTVYGLSSDPEYRAIGLPLLCTSEFTSGVLHLTVL